MEKKSKWQKWRQKFKFQAVDEASFEEKFAFRISWLQFNLILFAFVFLIAVFTFVLFTYTPLNYLLPSWRDNNYAYQYRSAIFRIDSLEQIFDQQRHFVADLQKFLRNESLEQENNLDSNLFNQPQEKTNLTPPRADSLLREQLANNPRFRDQEVENYIQRLFLSTPAPIVYKIDPFDFEKKHYHARLFLPVQSTVNAIAPGTIIALYFSIQSQHVIYIQHENNLISVYKNNASTTKKIGDMVETGEPIGMVSENINENFLDFELWDHGFPIDPQLYISF